MLVDLHRDQCDHWRFYADFIPGKELAVWQSGNKWNATARNRLKHARKMGYFDYDGGFGMWNLHREDIYRINTSAKERQGREMNPDYFKYPDEKNIVNTCPHHQYRLILVRYENRVLAYAIVHIAGELMNISTILGHAEFLKDGIMLPLMDRIQKTAIEHGVKFVTYYLWDSGTPGLQYFKHSTGFKPLELHERTAED